MMIFISVSQIGINNDNGKQRGHIAKQSLEKCLTSLMGRINVDGTGEIRCGFLTTIRDNNGSVGWLMNLRKL